jgi:hypothetical protein
MESEKIKKVAEKLVEDVNEVLDTSGGEMPNPNQKGVENAADAAKAFEPRIADKMNPKVNPKEVPKENIQDDKIKKAG